MTTADRAKLARILGMLGSEHAGERASAALQAEAFRKRHGMTWEEMLALPPVEVVVVMKPDPAMAAQQAQWAAEDAARKARWAAPQTYPEPPRPAPRPARKQKPPEPSYFPFHLPPGANHPIVMRYGIAAILFVAFAWKTYG